MQIDQSLYLAGSLRIKWGECYISQGTLGKHAKRQRGKLQGILSCDYGGAEPRDLQLATGDAGKQKDFFSPKQTLRTRKAAGENSSLKVSLLETHQESMFLLKFVSPNVNFTQKHPQ